MSEARDRVLADVRRALADSGSAPAEVTVPRGYRATAPVDAATVDLFCERVEDYRAEVVRCGADEVERVVADLVAGRRAVVPAGLPWRVEGAIVDDEGSRLSAGDLDAVDVVVTASRVAIAATGTVVLSHGPGEGRRVVTLVPDVHVCVVRADQVVADVPDAVAVLDPVRPTTWVSGPSATSDIELSRVEGVHGPRTLHVVLVG